MYPTQRQTVLNPILEALTKVPGVQRVQQDDFDSAGINVIVDLVGTKTKLAQRLQDTKRRLLAACAGNGRLTDWPASGTATTAPCTAKRSCSMKDTIICRLHWK